MGAVSEPLIQWFELNRRLLPFRQEPSAYHIWVSEIMLQQTRVSAALPYYERFVAELPDPAALAACDPDKLRKLWQGLGYYSRVANMQKAAQIVCRQYGGQLPADYAALRALPGIGDYTAGAIASIAFGIPAPAVDGNVLRVFARLDNSSADITKPAAKREFTARVLEEMPKERPGPYNEALMELGALVCLPNGAPKCEVCPLPLRVPPWPSRSWTPRCAPLAFVCSGRPRCKAPAMCSPIASGRSAGFAAQPQARRRRAASGPAARS